MKRMCTALLGAFALLALLASPAWAQEAKEKVWNGKRWEWVTRTPAEAKAPLMEVAREEAEIVGMKTVGKNVVTAYFRRAPAATALKGHSCDTRWTTVLKHYEVRHFCRVNGAEKPCPGMTTAGECLAVVE